MHLLGYRNRLMPTMIRPGITPRLTEKEQASRQRQLIGGLNKVRNNTHTLIRPLSPDDLSQQFDPIMSPLVWDLGHVGNFEELWLLREVGGHQPHNPHFDQIYDPFDNPRSIRADLEILGPTEAGDYMNQVRSEVLEILQHSDLNSDDPLLQNGYVFEMVTQHEAQHQETMLQALDLRSDLAPYALSAQTSKPAQTRRVDDTDRIHVPGGWFWQGTGDRLMAYDNERPAHRVKVPAFDLDRFPVTVRRFARFIEQHGYQRPELWSEEGRAWLSESSCQHPQHWVRDLEGGWLVNRFGRMIPLDPAEPVQHVSFFEAEAFARWAGGRLPTESEWEKAAGWDPLTGKTRPFPWGHAPPTASLANLDHQGWGPMAVGSYPQGASPLGAEQMLGDVYEWTSSWFEGYPGYATFPYPEYSEVFFGREYRVLRGASWATSTPVARNTFRNWDYPQRRQLFAGFRVAWEPR